MTGVWARHSCLARQECLAHTSILFVQTNGAVRSRADDGGREHETLHFVRSSFDDIGAGDGNMERREE